MNFELSRENEGKYGKPFAAHLSESLFVDHSRNQSISTRMFLGSSQLFSYGIGIHLLQSEDPEHMMKKSKIDPKDNHISFQNHGSGGEEAEANGNRMHETDG
ncbi:unnamed protein product [Camellia sinensis]